jgi:hypothetical protein
MSAMTPVENFCPHCGYSLRGLPTARCPECGAEVDLNAAVPVIPWRNRQRIGSVRAYFATVLYVLFRGKRLRGELAAPTGYRDARSFWRITMAIAYAPCILLTYGLLQQFVGKGNVLQTMEENHHGIIYATIAVNLGPLFFMLAATSLPGYFCLSRKLTITQQNRAIAMSYYACAAWLFLPLAAGAAYLGLRGLHLDSTSDFTFFCVILSYVLVGVGAVLWFFSTLRLICMATYRQVASAIILGIWLLVSWAALGVLLLVVFPFLFYSLLMLLRAW